MIYFSVKYCCSNSSIPGVILHSIREEWLKLVDWKRPNPNVICIEHFPSYIKVNRKKLSKSAAPSIFNIIGAVQNCSLETVLNEYNYAVPAIQKLKKMYDGKWVTEVRSKILIPLETTGGNSFSLEGFEKTLFTIQNFTQGDLHSTGGIQMSFPGAYNSTGGIQLSFLGVHKST